MSSSLISMATPVVDKLALSIMTGSFIYSVGLGCFRHSVSEDKGLIDSIKDTLQYAALFQILLKLDGIFNNTTNIVFKTIVSIVSLILTRTTFRKYVSGKCYNKDIKCTGKVYIITGCNTGIGYETAKAIVSMGGIVIMACRSLDKAQEAKNKIIKTTKCNPNYLPILQLDLCDFNSVRKFVNDFNKLNMPLHCLINNAGVMMEKRCETKSGLEMVMTANHFSHYLLTNLLLPYLNETNGRIVILTSSLHQTASSFNFEDIMSKKDYSLFKTYSQAKLANVMFMVELVRRLKLSKSKITCNAVHPGCVRTEVTRNMNAFMQIGNALAAPIMWTLQKTPEQGAYCSIYAATSPELVNNSGLYLFHCEAMKMNKAALDVQDNDLLWKVSQEVTLSNKEVIVEDKKIK